MMKTFYDRLTIVLFAFVAIAFVACNNGNQKAQQNAKDSTQLKVTPDTALTLTTRIPLPKVTGGFDLMSLDLKGKRLFLCAEDNHSLEVINLDTNQPILSIPDLQEPKWSFYDVAKNRIYVATGLDGKVTEIDGNTYKKIKEFQFKEACNNLRYDSTAHKLYVGVGKSFGALGIIDLQQDKIVGEIPLSGYLKQFEIDGDLIYVNIKDKNVIDVVDKTAGKVIATWPVKEAKENVPMALDKEYHRLFIGCEPGKFIVFSTVTGKSVFNLNISEGADGIYYDATRKLIYISCGEGTIEVIKQDNPDSYSLIKTIPTVKGAGTSLYSKSLDRLILATPKTENQSAGISIYKPLN
nr:hypothetical protein [uncultured Pedobacter sp.]